MNLFLKTKLRLLNIPTDPRYWVILIGISKHVKKFDYPFERSMLQKILMWLFYEMSQNQKQQKNNLKYIVKLYIN